ncbi:DUF120 domain-containing protein [Palaeococcus ferrophilus]|uniref:DUF120 domain-containing protein n=1 Tax=Palaeococcus ferrophilus TaxID=83868 RepID=UPI00064FFBB8|nr:DUF120 domain-containing protein [Palaeococcus ferrophilus]
MELELLLLLAREGAIGQKKPFTMRALGERMGTAPQTVMRKLDNLELKGYVTRTVRGRKTYIEITPQGIRFLRDLHEELCRVLHGDYMVGEVVSGLGEGAYYINEYRERIKEYLNFDPYPGTLNVKLIHPRTVFDAVADLEPIIIPGFVRGGRTFGDVRAYRVRVNGIEGAVVIPSRTIHPPEIAEIVAPLNVRESLNLKDGDRVRIEVVR